MRQVGSGFSRALSCDRRCAECRARFKADLHVVWVRVFSSTLDAHPRTANGRRRHGEGATRPVVGLRA
jgi:hypothetical protein